MMPRDTQAVKDVHLAEGTSTRVWTFARPYRSTIIIFLSAILIAALLALVPPLVVRAILDTAIPNGDRRLIMWLAGAAVVAALVDAGLQILQRWCSAMIGEGLIADLRIALVPDCPPFLVPCSSLPLGDLHSASVPSSPRKHSSSPH